MAKIYVFLLGLLLNPTIIVADVIFFGANESPPFWSTSLPYQGMCGEILQAMSEQAGLETKIEFKPLKRLIEDTENNDLGNPRFYIEQQDFAYILPIALYEAVFYYYEPNFIEQPIQFSTLADLKHYKIGILKGTLLDKATFEDLGIQFERSYSHASIVKKLKLGRIDLGLEIDLVSKLTINRLYPELATNFKEIRIPNTIAPIAIMINENLPNAQYIAQQYKQALQHIIEQGRYQNIIEKYYGKKGLPESWLKKLQRFEQLYNFGRME